MIKKLLQKILKKYKQKIFYENKNIITKTLSKKEEIK